MLQELTVRNFALLEEVQLAFSPGLNVLTGETGAGKSIIIDAIGTVLGGRAATDVIRTGAERASLEAIFSVPSSRVDAAPVRELLATLGLDEPGEADESDTGTLILSRELSRNGRSVARVNGRAVPVSTLAQVGAHLLDFHGQHEHLSLLRPGAQRDLLDRFGGLFGHREAVAALVKELRAVRHELASLQQDEREVARRIDLLSFQVEEIHNARLRPGEDEALAHERTLLANASRLAELATSIDERLAGGAGETPSALELLGSAARDLSSLVRIDPQVAAHEQLLAEASAQVEEIGRALRAYREAIEFAPDRLEEVVERREVIRNLQRKYGETIEEVLAFGERAGDELDVLANREARSAALAERAALVEGRIATAAAALSAARRAAGDRLSAAMAAELRALSLRGHFAVALLQEPDFNGISLLPPPPTPSGESSGAERGSGGSAAAGDLRVKFDETGIDTVEFRFAPNPGEPAKSVARTASGGELSRVLLALKSVLSAADRTPTLIFDEIDAGIGGRNGQVLGEKLAQLGGRHQVLCVTHLPQIAAYGDTHFYIAKQVRGGRTVTTVSPLAAEAIVDELAQMLGGATSTTREQARELHARAAQRKQQLSAEESEPRHHTAPAAEQSVTQHTLPAKPGRARRKRAIRDRPPLLQGVG